MERELFQPAHLLLILVIVLVLFGGKKIPELMKGLGHGVREFKNATKGETTDSKPKTEIEKTTTASETSEK